MKIKHLLSGLISFVLLSSVFVSAQGTKSYDWYFKPNKENAKPQIIPEASSFIDNYDTYYYDKSDNKVLYLTFDAGYDNGYHEPILNTLKEKGVRAAFFVDGNFLKKNPDLSKRIVSEGHLLCNHSLSHPDTSKISDFEKYKEQLDGWQALAKETTGTEPLKLFRPPMGKFSEQSLKYNKELGYKTIFWSFAYKDWEVNNQPDPENAKAIILERVHPGAIMLLHSTSKTNSQILGEVIDALKEQGYTFASLDSLTGPA